VITLEQNYRSTVPILDLSNAVMAQARERHTKNLWSARRGGETPVLLTCLDEQQQCEEVCDNVLEHHERGIALRDQAVLFRAGWHSDMLEVELSRRGIPFVKYGGIRFLESAHVKDVMALLRILDNPFDEIAWWRVLQLLPGVGPATVRRLMDELRVRVSARADGPALTPLQRLLTAPPEVPSAARDEFGELRSALEDCAFRSPDGAEIPPASQVERARGFCEKVWYHKYESPGSRLHDIEQLEQTASNFSTPSDFVSELTLDPPHSTEDLAGPPALDDDYLILSTIHSAKGCEWNVVHVLHASDGMIPSDMALKDDDGLEEERRLLYVAMTRAKDMLYVYFPLRYYHRRGALGDSHSYAQLSRFLTEAVRTRFEQQVAGVVAPARQATVGSPAGAAPVDSYLEELWGG
jgi:DNA helicase II / ATP-dependent DNA helicase PcrA